MTALTEKVDVVIVGAGPAGLSTALHLQQLDSNWASRIVVIDKAIHPRDKLCGGGVTQAGERILAGLGLAFEPDHIPIREVQLVYGNEAYVVDGDPAFRVTRRAQFDHWLLQTAEQRGVTIYQGEAVESAAVEADFVEIVTDQRQFQAQVVVVADGSRSTVRQRLGWPERTAPFARLLEVLTPESGEGHLFQHGVAIFDFSHTVSGLQGYYWDFPSLIAGQPVMNRGVFDSRVQPKRDRAALKATLAQSLQARQRNLADFQLKGHPIRWFDPRGVLSQPRFILAGDAAGVDPFLGEGISFALAYGQVAAEAIVSAFQQADFSFACYRRRVLRHHFLGQLVHRVRIARFLYSLKWAWQMTLVWKLMGFISRCFIWFSPNKTLNANPRLVKWPIEEA